MALILRIDSSSRVQDSHSRSLADYFHTAWLEKYPQDKFIVRDLIKNSCPHISDITIAGFYTPKEQHTEDMKKATALSDELIGELQSADILLLSVPMYNFSVPSALKAWIDQIVRIGDTFAYDGKNFTGLVTVKRAYIICAYGASGYTDDGAFSALNFLEPYLKNLFSFLGIPEIQIFNIQATTADEATVVGHTEQVEKEIDGAISIL
ncbi:MAG: NAD(P)H-dependent oxidoreductase [Waterburya sp.]